MNIIIQPGLIEGNIMVPPSKSQVHRLLIAAALAERKTSIHCAAESEDLAATVQALRQLGAQIERQGEWLLVQGDMMHKKGKACLDCHESGTTLRFLLPLCGMMNRDITLTGRGKLQSRPHAPLLCAMREHGAQVSGDCLPLQLQGGLRSGEYRLPGNISSQYFSALLLALPLLPGESTLAYILPLESAPYIAMTLEVLHRFGIRIEETENGWRIPGGQRYLSPSRIEAEGDWSAAACWITAMHLGNRIHLQGMQESSLQGDRAIVTLLQHLGGEVSVADTPDLLPLLAIAAACTEKETLFVDAGRLRLKESDRLSAMVSVINALGGKAEATEDRLHVFGQPLCGGSVDGFGDHRVVMSAAIAATVCKEPVTIYGADAVNKSYPQFFQVFSKLGGKIHGV